jgi:hypothetical protein
MSNRTTQQIVMGRVRTIYAVRPFLSNVALSSYILLGSLFGIGKQVFVAQVFHNVPSGSSFLRIGDFFISAFANTTALVQALSFIVLVAFVFVSREALRAFLQSIRRTSFA